MAVGINGEPNTYDFGEDFNYAVWPKDSILDFVNVNWNTDYRDVVKFASRAALNAFIDDGEAAGIRLENVSYLKPNQYVRVPITFNNALKYNYLRVRNPQQPVAGGDSIRDFYYFIQDIRYVAPDTTEIMIQLDVWQTYIYDIELGNCYIDRGHIGIANENQFDSYGREYLTIPEGLDYGAEYQVVLRAQTNIMASETFTSGGAAVLVVSTVDLLESGGTVTAPILKSAKGSSFEGLASGASIYAFLDTANFQSWLLDNQDTPWITQGIVSITLVPDFQRYMPNFGSAVVGDQDNSGPIDVSGYHPVPRANNMANNWRNNTPINSAIPARYSHLKKFFTYPYMVIELTTFTGKPIIIKPESWNDPNATVMELATYTPPNQRIVFYPKRYNAVDNSDIQDYGGDGNGQPTSWKNTGDDGGEYLDFATMIDNFPTLPIVNNGAISYLASNFASFPYQQASAAWSQQRALRGNQVSYDQQSGGIAASRQINALGLAGAAGMTASQNEALLQSAGNQVLGGLINSAVAIDGAVGSKGGGAMGGVVNGAAGAVLGGAQAQVQIDAANRAMGIGQVVGKAQNNAQNNQAGFVRDTNKSLGDWAARGDYENTIAGINAQIQGAAMMQPTTSGQQGGDAFNLVNGNVRLSLRWKLIDPASIRAIGDYWLRYGYAVRRFGRIPASFMVMEKFTYWKLLETYVIAGAMPESFKQTIRGIFEKGVTVWSNPDYIGNIDIADNAPLDGIVL